MLPIVLLTPPSLLKSQPDDSWNEPRMLADGVGRHAGAAVSIIRGSLRDAPAERFVLYLRGDIESELAELPEDSRNEVAARTLVLDARWPDVFRLLETHRLAGAVDLRDYWWWLDHTESDRGGRMYGLISVAERAGMRCESGQRFGSERYGQLSGREPGLDLPGLLFHYLSVYAEQRAQ
ncbi:MAG: hypothetical protein U1A78_26730 [Polyangia bacterium]